MNSTEIDQFTTINSTFGKYLPQLDSLRAIACLLVLFAHLKTLSGLGWIPENLGAVGVGIFFALSGFLITRGLIHKDQNLIRFYERRTARILPPYFAMLFVLAVVWPAKELIWAATFCFNFLYVTGKMDYFLVEFVNAPIPPITHVWSLCVEEHFYLIWPITLLVFRIRFAAVLAIGIILLTPVFSWATQRILQEYGFQRLEIYGLLQRITFTQLTAISWGCLVAIFEDSLSKKDSVKTKKIYQSLVFWSIASILVSGLLYYLMSIWCDLQLYTQTARVLARGIVNPSCVHLLSAGLFGLGLCWKSLGRIPVLREIGRVSYGLYLYHLPVYFMFGFTDSDIQPRWTSGIAAVGVSLILAIVSYKYLELPLLKLSHGKINFSIAMIVGNYQKFAAILLVLLLISCIGVAGVSARKSSQELNEVSVSSAQEVQEEEIPIGLKRYNLPVIKFDDEFYNIFCYMGVLHIVDDQGYRRSAPTPPKRTDRLRVLVTGDSYTYGACVKESEIFTNQAELMLHKEGFPVEFINRGFSGASAVDVEMRTEELIKDLNPEYFIYATTLSDFLPSQGAWEGHSLEEWEQSVTQERFLLSLMSIEQLCESAGIQFRVFIFSDANVQREQLKYIKIIESLCKKANVTHWTIENYIEKYEGTDFRVSEFDTHPNAYCHHIYGEFVAEHLIKEFGTPEEVSKKYSFKNAKTD
ncbi:O-acetyltransferase OatA [Rubinisphaera italica]|uniref:O-acetyltransferase OatA n=2 Tax=Rubinisphaera italica TaxID=2527969 RepID=A0A5C5XGV9_9PLAN|nr:O-acetyltransferase OatA [Rubinisphaera italica]